MIYLMHLERMNLLPGVVIVSDGDGDVGESGGEW
jgi:hypothetical protein